MIFSYINQTVLADSTSLWTSSFVGFSLNKAQAIPSMARYGLSHSTANYSYVPMKCFRIVLLLVLVLVIDRAVFKSSDFQATSRARKKRPKLSFRPFPIYAYTAVLPPMPVMPSVSAVIPPMVAVMRIRIAIVAGTNTIIE
jgi:hypothetical protein